MKKIDFLPENQIYWIKDFKSNVSFDQIVDLIDFKKQTLSAKIPIIFLIFSDYKGFRIIARAVLVRENQLNYFHEILKFSYEDLFNAFKQTNIGKNIFNGE